MFLLLLLIRAHANRLVVVGISRKRRLNNDRYAYSRRVFCIYYAIGNIVPFCPQIARR